MLLCFVLNAFMSSYFKQAKLMLQSSTFLFLGGECRRVLLHAAKSLPAHGASQCYREMDASISFVAVIKDAIFSHNTEVTQRNVLCVLKY